MPRNLKAGQNSRWRDRARMLDTAKRIAQQVGGMEAKELVQHVESQVGTPDKKSGERGAKRTKRGSVGRETRESVPTKPLRRKSSGRSSLLTVSKPTAKARAGINRKKTQSGLPDSVVDKWQPNEVPGRLVFVLETDLVTAQFLLMTRDALLSTVSTLTEAMDAENPCSANWLRLRWGRLCALRILADEVTGAVK